MYEISRIAGTFYGLPSKGCQAYEAGKSCCTMYSIPTGISNPREARLFTILSACILRVCQQASIPLHRIQSLLKQLLFQPTLNHPITPLLKSESLFSTSGLYTTYNSLSGSFPPSISEFTERKILSFAPLNA